MATAALERQCGAATRTGGHCRKQAGWGTPHRGTGACRLHGGNMPNHLIAAGRLEARVLGAPIDIEPHDALLYCVRRAAGDVAYYELKIAGLEEADAVGSATSVISYAEKRAGVERVTKTHREQAVDAHIWIRLRDQALDRLARFAKMAIDAGIEERQVRAAERFAETIASLVETLFDALGTSPKERAKVLPVLEARMLQLEEPSA